MLKAGKDKSLQVPCEKRGDCFLPDLPIIVDHADECLTAIWR